MSNVGTGYTLMGQKLSSTQSLEEKEEVRKITGSQAHSDSISG